MGRQEETGRIDGHGKEEEYEKDRGPLAKRTGSSNHGGR